MQGYACEWSDCNKKYKKAADRERHQRTREHELDDHNPARRPSLTDLYLSCISDPTDAQKRYRRAQVHLQGVRQALCQKRRPLEAPSADPRRAGAGHRPPTQVGMHPLRYNAVQVRWCSSHPVLALRRQAPAVRVSTCARPARQPSFPKPTEVLGDINVEPATEMTTPARNHQELGVPLNSLECGPTQPLAGSPTDPMLNNEPFMFASMTSQDDDPLAFLSLEIPMPGVYDWSFGDQDFKMFEPLHTTGSGNGSWPTSGSGSGGTALIPPYPVDWGSGEARRKGY
ncbi:hypothetical protein EHS25_004898 [Saitozyma podzolica]|uniref:C2H2-type domain-containing protein n=1 Tax=Saitozyma podzolica TaxID=1890683 RepID=A0A427Y322_9TREE|nr:hypothetical protein EHS25_004898 [Saitozyma podzolica]